ncbi:hypothetical protein D9758_001261 [Tetrapyrgos nigripes]|uniref:Carbohydrate kinase PfkB domain-containing protein n=1 Tax=Tetrapyrgos nigripes TaxID=182062 RepID=A0A8H5GS27_9AGAR|nr:hypothetical protein D9758_001261 [Tetrapyrgos nigripes]
MSGSRAFVTLGMFIIDEFTYADENGEPTGKTSSSQENWWRRHLCNGWSTDLVRLISFVVFQCFIMAFMYFARLPPHQVGMIVDKGHDFPPEIQVELEKYGSDMWMFRNQPEALTTRALNSYRGDIRKIRITPRDLNGTKLEQPRNLHFICSPSRASVIMSEVNSVPGWNPTTIYEPIPVGDRCIPEELPALKDVLPSISILSPNAEEALSLLSYSLPPNKISIEHAASKFLELGVKDAVIIRSGAMGAYIITSDRGGRWISAFWNDAEHVVDVTGAGNSFLGGLAAGLEISGNDIYEAIFYATVSASFTIEQPGLPILTNDGWNGDSPFSRLDALKKRH